MSIRAIDWVLNNDQIGSSQDKFVLLVLANYVSDTGLAWPAISTIARKTSQDRKTVIAALHRLEGNGWIEDTGRRVGKTRQIKVYFLSWAHEQKESKKQNSSVFPNKESPKRDTEPSTEPSIKEPPTVPHRGTGVNDFNTTKEWLNRLFGRKRPWLFEEEQLLATLLPIGAHERELLSWGYALPRDSKGWALVNGNRATKPKENLVTLLREFGSEIDKWRSVRSYGSDAGDLASQPEIEAWTDERKRVFRQMFPDVPICRRFGFLSKDIQRDIDKQVRLQADEIPAEWVSVIKRLYGIDVPIPQLKSQLASSVRTEIEAALKDEAAMIVCPAMAGARY